MEPTEWEGAAQKKEDEQRVATPDPTATRAHSQRDPGRTSVARGQMKPQLLGVDYVSENNRWPGPGSRVGHSQCEQSA